MKRFRPDFDRRIDLSGAGPCPRPVDIDRSVTGFTRLVALRVYSFAQGVAIDGEAEDDEVFIVLMRGQADFAIAAGGQPVGTFALRHEHGLRAIYMPPHAAYHLTAVADCDIAYARVQPDGTGFRAACGFAPDMGRLDIAGYALGMDLVLVALRPGTMLRDDVLSERFVHLRGEGATIDGVGLGDWDAVALSAGEAGLLDVEAGSAEVLIISASVQQ